MYENLYMEEKMKKEEKREDLEELAGEYKPPELVSESIPDGSFAATCPSDSRGGWGCCDACDRRE
jgi:hypothetical protein